MVDPLSQVIALLRPQTVFTKIISGAGRWGVRYTEFGMFQHADPTKRKLPLPRLVSELSKFYRFVYPMYRRVA